MLNNSVNIRYPQSDIEAIEWLEKNIDKEIRELFDKNYEDACDELLKKEIEIPDSKEFDEIKNQLKNYFKIDGFRDSLKKNLNYDDEIIENIINKLDNENTSLDNNEKIFIIKMYRYYNMFLKYGHSAKATWVANQILNNILLTAEKNGKKIYKYESSNELIDELKLLKKVVLTSAFLHDIGRFYQAINYNTLLDNVMKDGEKEIPYGGNKALKVDHAIAGYFYSIAKAFNLTDAKDPEKTAEDFVTETLTALVVRYHSLPNTKLKHFESGSFLESLNEEDSLTDNICDFFVNCYKSMGKTPKEKEKYAILLPYTFTDFVDNVISKTKNKISEKIKYNANDENEGFVENDEIEKTLNEITNKVEKLIKDLLGQKKYKNPTTFNYSEFAQEVAKGIATIIYGKNNITEEEIKNDINEIIKLSLDYDIASKINDEMLNKSENAKGLNSLAKYVISASISIVTDSDKIDIFDQRAKGIYNSPYIMESISIYPPKEATFSYILKDYFKFQFENEYSIDSFEYGEEIINLINQKSNINTKNYIQKCINKFSGNDKINSSNFVIQKIKFKNGIGTVVYTTDDNTEPKEITGKEIYQMFNETPWYDIALHSHGLSVEDIKVSKENHEKFKALKQKHFKDQRDEKTNEITEYTNITLTISRHTFEKNLQSLEPEERIKAFRYLVVGKDKLHDTVGEKPTIASRFKLNEDNKIGIGWINENFDKDNEHLVSSSLSGLIWQLNQFIFVNMRNVYSLQIIKNEGLLDNIHKQYKEKANANEPPVTDYEAQMVEEYIEYTKGFIDYILKYCNTHNIDFLTPAFLEDCRKGYEEVYVEKLKIKE